MPVTIHTVGATDPQHHEGSIGKDALLALDPRDILVVRGEAVGVTDIDDLVQIQSISDDGVDLVTMNTANYGSFQYNTFDDTITVVAISYHDGEDA